MLAGSIFGDHCSPISDTTILSSIASGCRHEEHVWTQLPYAVVTAIVAMGLGDVHLMGAAGAVIGPLPVVVAFFIAPFFGLAAAGCLRFFKKIRQIPYGPSLSLGVLTVMIFHDWIFNRLGLLLYR